MKKKIIALIAAAAVAASMSAGVFAAGTPDVQSGTEVYMSMSGSERTDFIDANLDTSAASFDVSNSDGEQSI